MQTRQQVKIPDTRGRWRVLTLLLGLVALASTYMALVPLVERAGSATAQTPLIPYEIQGDRFSNYDFLSESYKRDNVDWAVDLVFAHGGTINRVKDQLDPPFHIGRAPIDLPGVDPVEAAASPMWARINDGPQGSGGEWDEDAGKKTELCQTEDEPNIFHFRIYAPEDSDHFVNQKWGNYIIGTSHIDHNECAKYGIENDGTPAWAGNSEQSEHFIANHSRVNFESSAVYEDRVWVRNWNLSLKVNHWWVNDGKATFIDVSGKTKG
jgi:hypothetical protein